MIPNHIKIGNAGKILSQYISENNFSKIGFLSDNNSSKYCLNRILENHKFDYHTITIEEGEENKSLSTCEKHINQRHTTGKSLLPFARL